MADAFKLDLQGLNQVLSRFDKLDANLKQAVDDELTASAEHIAREAKQNFQVLTAGFSSLATKRLRKVKRSTGTLLNRISANISQKYAKTVSAQAKYAAYVEFGTGGLVEIPSGVEAYAAQFKGSGRRKINLPARPFMFPAFFAEKPRLIKRIADLLIKK